MCLSLADAEDEDAAEPSSNKLSLTLSSARVGHAKYPFFVPPNKKDEMAPDALNDVITYETDIDLVMKTPFFDLQVPAQSRLLGYNQHEVHLGYDYVEPVLARSLRTGAKVRNNMANLPVECPCVNATVKSLVSIDLIHPLLCHILYNYVKNKGSFCVSYALAQGCECSIHIPMCIKH